MNNQQAPKQLFSPNGAAVDFRGRFFDAAPKIQPTGRPLWQVSLKASLQRRRKRRQARLYASALQHCPASLRSGDL
jgi:hypothetical protein